MSFVRKVAPVLAVLRAVSLATSQSSVPSILGDYWNWREQPKPPPHADTLVLLGGKLRSGGLSEGEAAAKIELAD